MINLNNKWCKLLSDKLGDLLWFEDGVPTSIDEVKAQSIIDAFDMKEQELADAKALEMAYVEAISAKLDLEAKNARYFNIDSACGYASFPNPFQAESQSFVAWRGAVWMHCYSIQEQVKAGSVPAPTVEELIAGLPSRVV